MQNLAALYSSGCGRAFAGRTFVPESAGGQPAGRGPEHPKTLGEMANLAPSLRFPKRFSEAAPLIDNAVNNVAARPRPESGDAAGSLRQGAMYQEGRYAAAEPLLAQLVESERRVFGP